MVCPTSTSPPSRASGGTLAIYMGLATLPKLREGLLRHGMASDMPAALIENGGTHRQRVLHGTLDRIAAMGRDWSSGGPALLLLGETVAWVNRTCLARQVRASLTWSG